MANQIIIYDNEIPIIRSGNGILYLLGLLIWVYITVNIVININELKFIGYVLLIIGGCYLLHKFLYYTSKIKINNEQIEMVTSVQRFTFKIKEIDTVKVFAIPISRSVTVRYKIKSKKLPFYFSFVLSKKSNIGNYTETLNFLYNLLMEQGLQVKKNY